MTLLLSAAQPSAQDDPPRGGRTARPGVLGGRVYPDLKVQRASASGEFAVRVEVANIGAADSRGFTAELSVYYADNTLMKELSRPCQAIPKGETRPCLIETAPLSLAGKRFRVKLVTDRIQRDFNVSNNTSAMVDGPPVKPPPPKTSPTVDLAAQRVFLDRQGGQDGIAATILNLGNQKYSGSREAAVTLYTVKDGEKSTHTIGRKKVPDIRAGGYEVIFLPRPPDILKHSDGYRLTLNITGGDNNPSNDSKTETSEGFAASKGGSKTADLKAVKVRMFNDGTPKIEGVVRNVSSKRYRGEREVQIYFKYTTSGGEKKDVLIASDIVKDLEAGAEWRLVGELPANLRKVHTHELYLVIQGDDINAENDQLLRKTVAID